jgi:hypothetical protein
MANNVQGLLTTYASTAQVDLSYFFVVSGSGYVPNYNTSSYFYIGKVKSWPDDNAPPEPSQSQHDLKTTFKNMVATKLLTSTNMSPVIPRKDWLSGTVYDEYNDKVDMFEVDANGNLVKKFYVRNHFDQVFKCLCNHRGGASTVEPVLKSGTTEPSQTLYLADGYKWIYITTIDKGLKKNFFDNNWMPITIGSGRTDPSKSSGLGSINSINVVTTGDGNYTNGSNSTTITITGDGQGAKAYGKVINGMLNDVIVTNTGNNYTYANVTVSTPGGYLGNNATAVAQISPVGGHASDPASELGCNHVMISISLQGTENGNIPTDIAFRQLGIIVNPQLQDGTTPKGDVYNLTDLAYVTFGTGAYTIGETIYQGTTLNNATFKAEVGSFDRINNIIYLININGNYQLSQPIKGVTSGTTRVLVQYSQTDFKVGSGYLIYCENRTPVQRSVNSNEQFRLVLSY